MADIVVMGDKRFASIIADSCCAFGVFDGVHKGHRFVIGRAIERAQEIGKKSTVLTFDIDPDELFAPQVLAKLMTNDERLETLATSGVDHVAVLHFTREFASLAPDTFLHQMFDNALPASLHVGEDFKFGFKASGNAESLVAWGRAHGVDVEPVPLLEIDGAPVSSTRIRSLISEGRIEEAKRLL